MSFLESSLFLTLCPYNGSKYSPCYNCHAATLAYNLTCSLFTIAYLYVYMLDKMYVYLVIVNYIAYILNSQITIFPNILVLCTLTASNKPNQNPIPFHLYENEYYLALGLSIILFNIHYKVYQTKTLNLLCFIVLCFIDLTK